MSKPGPDTLVSIALCTYNGGRFLAAQLDSILSQTHRNLELIIVDDCSTDATGDIIKTYAGQAQRIRFEINTGNLGYNRNFEKGLSLCRAEYIAPSDQDDIWEPLKIEAMLKGWKDQSNFMYSLSGDFWGDDFGSRRAAPNVRYADIAD